MNVLLASHQSRTDFMGGAERYLVWLAGRLRRDPAFSPLLLASNEGLVTAACRSAGVPCRIEPYGVCWEMLGPDCFRKGSLDLFLAEHEAAVKGMERLLKVENIDLLLANTVVNILPIIAAQRLNIPVLWCIHEVFAAHAVTPLRRFFPMLVERRRFGSFLRRSCRLLIFNSNKSRRSFEWFPGSLGGARTLYPPVRDELFSDGMDYRREPDMDSFMVGFAGMLVEHKGVLDFLQAAYLALKQTPGLRFHLCGGWVDLIFRRRVEDFIRDHGLASRIAFSGPLEDMRPFYRCIDCLVLPSLYHEPFGLVALEAMAYGIPLIVYHHTGAAELVRNGRNGYVVARRPRFISERINDLAQKRRLVMSISAEAKNTAREHGTPERHYEQLKQLVLETAPAPSKGLL